MSSSNRQSRRLRTSSRPRTCPDDDILAAWLTHTSRARDDITAHVEQCSRCERLAVRFAELFAPSSRSSASTRLEHGLPLAPGTPIARYTIQRVLGRGGFGTVYAAFDTTLRRTVALKIMPRSHGAEAFLRREARALASISHPNVVEVFDVGMLGEHPFIAMELVDGPTLRTFVALQQRSWCEIQPRFVEAGQALAAAHEHGLVHGDFKPDNVLCGPDGRSRVTDFGIGALVGSGPGFVAGTRAYAPPGSDARTWGTALDVYAWAASLVELTERASPPSARSSVPRHVWAMLHRCLACADPADMPSMKEVLAVVTRPIRRRRALFVAAASIAVIGAAAGVYPNSRKLEADARETASVSAVDSRLETLDALNNDSDFRTAARLSERLLRDATVAKTPALAARAHFALGRALLGRDASDQVAQWHLQRALELSVEARDPLTKTRALIGLHRIRRQDSTAREASALARRIELELAQMQDHVASAELRQEYFATLADAEFEAGAFDEAARAYARALAACPSGDPVQVGQIAFLRHVSEVQVEGDVAEPGVRRALDELRTTVGPHHRATILAHESYAWYLASHGRIDDAARELAEAVAGWTALVGGLGHPETIKTELLLGELDIKFGLRDADPARIGRGVAGLDGAVERVRRLRGDHHILTAKLRIRALGQRAMAGELEPTLRVAERLRVDLQAILGSGSPLVHQVSLTMVHILLELGHLQRAERELRGLLDASEESPAAARTQLPAYLYSASVLWQLGRRDEACGHALTALSLAEALNLEFGRAHALDRLSRCDPHA